MLQNSVSDILLNIGPSASKSGQGHTMPSFLPFLARKSDFPIYIWKLNGENENLKYINTTFPVIPLNETEMWAQQAALCSRILQRQ